MLERKKYPTSNEREVRQKARSFFISVTDNSALVNAAVEFVTASYYITQGIGDPEKHLILAIKKAEKLGLGEAEIEQGKQLAESFFSPDAKTITEKDKKGKQLRRKYNYLMSTPVEQLRIIEANKRNYVRSDHVWKKGNSEVKEKINQRTMIQKEYNKEFGNVAEVEDPIVLNIHGYNREKIAEHVQRSLEDQPETLKLFANKKELVIPLIVSLIKGGIISGTQLRRADLDPNQLIQIAKNRFVYEIHHATSEIFKDFGLRKRRARSS